MVSIPDHHRLITFMTDRIKETTNLILNSPLHMDCLIAAGEQDLPDWFIGAGFLRNAIWDHLHNKMTMTPLNDVDLVYFDGSHISAQFEEETARQLKALCPWVDWEVKNQARMHSRHNHQPYRSTTEGISYWVEVPTCVGVKLTKDDQLEFTAPFGLEENWSLDVKVNPENPGHPLFRERVEKKRWLEIWPELNCIFEE